MLFCLVLFEAGCILNFRHFQPHINFSASLFSINKIQKKEHCPSFIGKGEGGRGRRGEGGLFEAGQLLIFLTFRSGGGGTPIH